ncbi:cysteine-rich CWC family protein [Shewanella sp. A14]
MSVSSQRCPICHQGNACSMASGQAISSCWCVESRHNAIDLIKMYLSQHPSLTIRSDQCVCESCLAKMDQMVATPFPAVQLFKP